MGSHRSCHGLVLLCLPWPRIPRETKSSANLLGEQKRDIPIVHEHRDSDRLIPIAPAAWVAIGFGNSDSGIVYDNSTWPWLTDLNWTDGEPAALCKGEPIESTIVEKRPTRLFSRLTLTILNILEKGYLESKGGGWSGKDTSHSSSHSIETASLTTRTIRGWGSDYQSEKNFWPSSFPMFISLPWGQSSWRVCPVYFWLYGLDAGGQQPKGQSYKKMGGYQCSQRGFDSVQL